MCIAFLSNAQWVSDPATNTLINNSHDVYDEIMQSRCPNGDFYVQFCNSMDQFWSPKLMYVSKNGVPMWSEPVYLGQTGLIASHGMSICATSDNCAVSHFMSVALGESGAYAVKVNPSGEIVWGPVQTSSINYHEKGRTEVIPDNNGGVWVSSTDFLHAIHIRHIDADGTMGTNLVIPVGEVGGGYQKMILAPDGCVLMPYHKHESAYTSYYIDQSIWVARISQSGELISDNPLMSTTTTEDWSQLECVSDGLGGGYVWLQRKDDGTDCYNIYVMHFAADGTSTTYESYPIGVQTCPADMTLHRWQSSGTYDVATGDFILVFLETDKDTGSHNSMRAVRVSQTGEIVNGQGGSVIIPTSLDRLDKFRVASAADKSITIVYCFAEQHGMTCMKALGTDSNFMVTWAKDFNTNPCNAVKKEIAEGAYEFADGQFVVFFQDNRNDINALYGQNIQPDGTLGQVVENPCSAPTNLAGKLINDGTMYGAQISWTAATGNELSFNIYKGVNPTTTELIGSTTEHEYFDDLTGQEGSFTYVVKAVCQEGESDPATTPEGVGYVVVNSTGVDENCDNDITVYQNGNEIIIDGIAVDNVEVYNISGQLVKRIAENANVINVGDLNAGLYLVNIKADGMKLSKKIIVR